MRPLDLDAGMAGVGEPHYAIVDIGSNSVRMVVYDQLGRAPLPRYVEKSLCRLGDGLAETGAISQDGFRRTVEALRRFRAIADAMGVARIDVTATEAIRRASNGPELALAIRDASGLAVRILQGIEEARHSALGVISGFFRPVGLVADMGGGSLEIAEALDDHVGEHWTSLPLGALPVEALLKNGVSEAKRQIDGCCATACGVRSECRSSTPSAVAGALSPKCIWRWRKFPSRWCTATPAPPGPSGTLPNIWCGCLPPSSRRLPACLSAGYARRPLRHWCSTVS